MAMVDRVTFTFIRHGLTPFNEKRKYIGSTNLPLSERGVEQMQRLAPLIHLSPQLIVASTLLRTQQTVEILFPDQSFEQISLINEYDFGKWEGKSYEQLKNHPAYRQWLSDQTSVTPPGGECLESFKKRIKAGFNSIVELANQRNSSSIVVVTHGGVIRQWLTWYAPAQKSFFEWDVAIGSIFTLNCQLDSLRRGERFTSLQEEHFTEKIDGQRNLSP